MSFQGPELAEGSPLAARNEVPNPPPDSAPATARLPLGAPLFPNADAPELQAIIGAFFAVFLIGATLQVLRLRKLRLAPV